MEFRVDFIVGTGERWIDILGLYWLTKSMAVPKSMTNLKKVKFNFAHKTCHLHVWPFSYAKPFYSYQCIDFFLSKISPRFVSSYYIPTLEQENTRRVWYFWGLTKSASHSYRWINFKIVFANWNNYLKLKEFWPCLMWKKGAAKHWKHVSLQIYISNC